MKVAASIGTPTSSDTRTIGSTSAMTVRAAQFMSIGSFWSTISRARRAHLGHGARARAGKADVGRAHAEIRHQVKQADLHLHRRIDHRRALQPVAQRLVVQHDAAVGVVESAAPGVPVEDEFVAVHGHSLTLPGGGVKRVGRSARMQFRVVAEAGVAAEPADRDAVA